jgi:hypothetical protein
MYSLPQAGIIAQELLAKRLKEHGYTQSKTMPGLWTHKWQPITFSLVVTTSGLNMLARNTPSTCYRWCKKYYKCSFETEGEQYCGLTIKWDPLGKKVHLSMPSYVENALKQFQHPPPIVPQDQLHPHVHKHMGQMCNMQRHPRTPPLNQAGKKFIQEVTGVFLFLT